MEKMKRFSAIGGLEKYVFFCFFQQLAGFADMGDFADFCLFSAFYDAIYGYRPKAGDL